MNDSETAPLSQRAVSALVRAALEGRAADAYEAAKCLHDDILFQCQDVDEVLAELDAYVSLCPKIVADRRIARLLARRFRPLDCVDRPPIDQLLASAVPRGVARPAEVERYGSWCQHTGARRQVAVSAGRWFVLEERLDGKWEVLLDFEEDAELDGAERDLAQMSGALKLTTRRAEAILEAKRTRA